MKKILCFVFILIAAGIFIAGDAYFDAQEDIKTHQNYAQLIPLIGLEADESFETKADKVRAFIFEHTRYSVGEDFKAIWGKPALVTNAILAHAQSPASNGEEEKPSRAPLECSARSGVMESIFITLGYNVRSVSVRRHKKNYPAHSFTEVQNPETGKWHTQDAQYNIYWRVKDTGERASIQDIIKHDFDEIEPCISPSQCGWNLPNRENNLATDLKPKLGLAAIKDYQRDERPLYVNLKRFDFNTPVEVRGEQKTFCEFQEKNCRGEITLYE